MNVMERKIFTSDESIIRNDLELELCYWWLRSVYFCYSSTVGFVHSYGVIYYNIINASIGVLPACTI